MHPLRQASSFRRLLCNVLSRVDFAPDNMRVLLRTLNGGPKVDHRLNDEELIRHFRSGAVTALEEIVERYYRNRFYYYHTILNGFWLRVGEGECNAVFFSTILSAVDNYRFSEITFRTYFHSAIRYNLYRLEEELFPKAEEGALSLDEGVGEDGDECPLSEFVSAGESEDPSVYYDFTEAMDKLESLVGKLSPFDAKVAYGKIQGESLQSIARTLHCSIKKVRVADHRLVALAKKALQKRQTSAE